MRYQVMEKEAFGTDWSLVRYGDQSTQTFNSEDEAVEAAAHYLTEVNVNNALTVDEKKANVEAFMVTPDGCLLGVLDGERWFMTNARGDRVDRSAYELDQKTEVAVRPVPGS